MTSPSVARPLPDEEWVDCRGITVCSLPGLYGGGLDFGVDFPRLLGAHFAPVDTLLEWCAGPGYIGFTLLGMGWCRRLVLADVNPLASVVCQRTVERNDLQGRVTIRTSEALSGLSPGDRFDLVVANPPHSSSPVVTPRRGPELIYMDRGWRAHRGFWSTIREHLRPNASVLLQENGDDSSVADFTGMIEQGGLRLRGTFPCASPGWENIYYVWADKPGRGTLANRVGNDEAHRGHGHG